MKTPSTTSQAQDTSIPTHVAIIMDGNGRWAAQRGLPRIEGHRTGTENCRIVVRMLSQYGVRYLTLYAFSTENWSRPYLEIRGLFALMGEFIKHEVKALHQNNIRIRHMGSSDGLPKNLQRRLQWAVELTKNNTGMTLNIALNYGSRSEIIDAIQRITRDNIDPQNVNEQLLANYLYTAGIPDPDLIIRTGGEMRVSNFLLWQGAYSEYYFTPTLWPDFNESEVKEALAAYNQRERRFGSLKTRDATVVRELKKELQRST